jgi:hypothetical protein
MENLRKKISDLQIENRTLMEDKENSSKILTQPAPPLIPSDEEEFPPQNSDSPRPTRSENLPSGIFRESSQNENNLSVSPPYGKSSLVLRMRENSLSSQGKNHGNFQQNNNNNPGKFQNEDQPKNLQNNKNYAAPENYQVEPEVLHTDLSSFHNQLSENEKYQTVPMFEKLEENENYQNNNDLFLDEEGEGPPAPTGLKTSGPTTNFLAEFVEFDQRARKRLGLDATKFNNNNNNNNYNANNSQQYEVEEPEFYEDETQNTNFNGKPRKELGNSFLLEVDEILNSLHG